MRIFPRFRALLLLTASASVLIFFGGRVNSSGEGLLGDGGASLPPAAATPATGWLLLPEFPASATQADVGAEVYRLVCQDCHGDRRQGLTADWIATWPEEHQNCWNSKCHAANHPPDGFDLPHYVPALGGAGALGRFTTALDLYQYIRANMPWHNPGSLTNEQYWQLTAFLIREQGISVSVTLADESARDVQLHRKIAAEDQPKPAPQRDPLPAGRRCARA